MGNLMGAPQAGARSVVNVQNLSCGYIVWWTVHTGVYNRDNLFNDGQVRQLPADVLDYLIGGEALTAWVRSTNIPKSGIAARDSDPECTARYVTKDVKDPLNPTKLLVRERVSNTQKVLTVAQVGILTFDGSFRFDHDPYVTGYQDEVNEIVASMATDYASRIGQIDDIKVRETLTHFIKCRYAIAVRKSGGIYYLPHRENLAAEIVAIAEWMNAHNLGELSSIEFYETPGTTLTSLVNTAASELTAEAEAIAEKMTGLINGIKADKSAYDAKQIDDAQLLRKNGSYGYTITAYEQNIKDLADKLNAVEGSLGQTVGVLALRLEKMLKTVDQVKEKTTQTARQFAKPNAKTVKPKVVQTKGKGVKRKNV